MEKNIFITIAGIFKEHQSPHPNYSSYAPWAEKAEYALKQLEVVARLSRGSRESYLNREKFTNIIRTLPAEKLCGGYQDFETSIIGLAKGNKWLKPSYQKKLVAEILSESYKPPPPGASDLFVHLFEIWFLMKWVLPTMDPIDGVLAQRMDMALLKIIERVSWFNALTIKRGKTHLDRVAKSVKGQHPQAKKWKQKSIETYNDDIPEWKKKKYSPAALAKEVRDHLGEKYCDKDGNYPKDLPVTKTIKTYLQKGCEDFPHRQR